MLQSLLKPHWTEAPFRSPALTQSCIPCDPPDPLPAAQLITEYFLLSSPLKAKAHAALL